MNVYIRHEAHAAALPVGTVLTTPTGLTTAVKREKAFRNGRPGWYINGADFPVSSRELFAYGRNWTVKDPS